MLLCVWLGLLSILETLSWLPFASIISIHLARTKPGCHACSTIWAWAPESVMCAVKIFGPTGQWDRSHVLPCFYIVGPVGNVLTRVTLRLLCDLRHHAAEHNCSADCGLLPNAEAWEILKQDQRDLIVYPHLWVWLFDVSKAWAHGPRVQFGDVTWQL